MTLHELGDLAFEAVKNKQMPAK